MGVLLGLLALTRAEGVLIAIVCISSGLLGCWQQRRSSVGAGYRMRLLPWACLVLACVLTIAPWTLRNARQLGAINQRLGTHLPTFVPLTLYGPLNLALANHPGADGAFSRDVLSSQMTSGVLDLTDPQHLDFVVHGHLKAWHYMRQHPGDFIQLVWKKWSLASQAANLEWSQWNIPGGLSGVRRPVDMFVPDTGPRLLIVALTLLGLLLGLCTAGGPRRWSIVVLCVSLSVMLITGLFFGYARQWLFLLPFWFASSAAALVWLSVWLCSRVRGRRGLPQTLDAPLGRVHLVMVVAIVLSMLILEGFGSRANRNYVASGTTLPGSRRLNPDLPVGLALQPPQVK